MFAEVAKRHTRRFWYQWPQGCVGGARLWSPSAKSTSWLQIQWDLEPTLKNLCRGGETAYALVSGTSDRKVVWVQIPSSAPKTCCRSGFCASHNNALPCNPLDVAGARRCLPVSGVKLSLDCISHRFHQMTRSGLFIYLKPILWYN